MLDLIAKIKKFIKECVELFNEAERFRIEHDLPHYEDLQIR